MFNLSLAALVALASAPAMDAQPLVAARSRAVEPTADTPHVPQWTQLGLEGGTISGITRWPDGRLLAAGNHLAIAPPDERELFFVESSTLGADWTLIHEDDRPTIFMVPRVIPARAADGTMLLFGVRETFYWNENEGEWWLTTRGSTGWNLLEHVDVGRGYPATALLGLSQRPNDTHNRNPPALVAYEFARELDRKVTPPQAAGMEPLAVTISDLDGETWAAAFDSGTDTALLTVSYNRGDSWEDLPAPPAGRVNALTWQGERLLLAVDLDGLFVLEGDEWQRVDDGHSSLRQVRILEVSPHDERVWYAVGRSGLSRSADAGASWTHAVEGTTDHVVTSIFVDPSDPALVFVGIEDEAVLASDDSGQSFIPAGDGIGAAAVVAIASNPANPRHLAVVQVREDRPRIRESHDAGATWSSGQRVRTTPRELTFGHDGTLWMLGQRADDEQDMALYRRERGHWVRTALPKASGKTGLEFVQLGEAPGTLFVGGGGTSGSVEGTSLAWRSEDHGHSWSLLWEQPSEAGIRDSVRGLVEVPGTDGQELVIDLWDHASPYYQALRLHHSTDAGSSWMQVPLPGSELTREAHWLCADPFQPGRLLATYVGGRLLEIDLSAPSERRVLPGSIPTFLTAFTCWFHEGQMRFLAVSRSNWEAFYGHEGSDEVGSATPEDWPAGDSHAVHRWSGGLLLGTTGGLWHAPLEETFPAPVLTSATDSGARMQAHPRLVWTGGSDWVRILRNGEEVAWVRNTGTWSARLMRLRQGAAEYTVCNGFDEACSDPMVPGR